MMHFVQNFPLFAIILTLSCAVISSVLSGKNAKRLTTVLMIAVLAMNAAVLAYTLATGDSYVYRMGHFPAPWGNEIRIGVLEETVLTTLLLVVLFSFLGGLERAEREIEPTKFNLYCVVYDLSMLSLMAMVLTNDIFTAFVFIEINTLAAAGLVMMRQNGRSLVAGVRYMVMNLLGSGLFLLGTVILYTVSGHLLMTPIHEAVERLMETDSYREPLAVVVGLMSVGLAMKSALFPFDKWLPAAYSNATSSAAAMLSSVISKGYLFLLIKIYVRVIGLQVIRETGICDVLFLFGAVGMIAGSVNAVRVKSTRLMIAYSSVAQIGYIFLCIGMGTEAGLLCATWHILAHGTTKSLLFLTEGEISEASGNARYRSEIRGAFWRAHLPAAIFSICCVNMIGMPLMSIFVTKLNLASAAIEVGGRHMVIALAALIVSTVLNVAYFMQCGASLYVHEGETEAVHRTKPLAAFSMVALLVVNLLIGLLATPIYQVLTAGLASFM